MKARALKTLEQLKRLRETREQRAHERMVLDKMAAQKAAERVGQVEDELDTTRRQVILSERQAFDATIGSNLSLADLSRLQSHGVAGAKRLTKLGSDLAEAVDGRAQATDRFETAKDDYRLRQKAHGKITAARDEAKRRADKRHLVLEELMAEEIASEARRR